MIPFPDAQEREGAGDVRQHRPELRQTEPCPVDERRQAVAPPCLEGNCRWCRAADPGRRLRDGGFHHQHRQGGGEGIDRHRCRYLRGDDGTGAGQGGESRGGGEALPYGDGTFDRVTCAFGIRNFEHKEKGLEEFLRILRPGGKAVILELSVPQNKVVRWAYDLYFTRLLPRIGGAVSGDKAAYRYLPASVHNFPSPKDFCKMMEQAGFTAVHFRTFTFGLCRMFVGARA